MELRLSHCNIEKVDGIGGGLAVRSDMAVTRGVTGLARKPGVTLARTEPTLPLDDAAFAKPEK